MSRKNNVKTSKGYRVRVYLGVIDGKPKYKSCFGKTQKEANEKADALRASLNKGIDVINNDATFSSLLPLYLKIKKTTISDSEHRTLAYRLNYFNEYVAAYPVAKIKIHTLQQIIDNLAAYNQTTGKPSSKKTVRDYIIAINGFFEFLIDDRIIEFNPARNLTVPKVAAKQVDRRALTSEEQQWVREFKHRAQLPSMISMLCGLRKGELTALQWTDIDFKHNTISVNKSYDFKSHSIKEPKTKNGIRIVPMPSELAEYLKTVPRKNIYVITTTEGNMMSSSAWNRLYKYYMNALNREYGYFGNIHNLNNQSLPMVIKPFTLHCLRHTYATILYDAGIGVVEAKKLLGHADIKTTLNIYTHLSKEKTDLSIEKLENYLKNKSVAPNVAPKQV